MPRHQEVDSVPIPRHAASASALGIARQNSCVATRNGFDRNSP